MKLLRSLPKDRGFFDVYALLIKVIRKSKTAAQIVSGLTEIGIIYAIAYQSIYPILPDFVIYISGIVAIIFTMVIEGGLRVLTPCKQQDELNRFRQNKLDRFRQDELNTLGKTPSLVICTKSRENEELSNPTCDVILPDQAVASGEIHDFPD